MDVLMTTWDGAGCTPPIMSVAAALAARGHDVRVLADPTLAPDVEAAGVEHLPWTRAPHRTSGGARGHFVEDYEAGPEGFARMRDRLGVGPAAAFAADVRAELERRSADVVLTEALLFGPIVAAEALGIPCIALSTTINFVPADGVPPFGFGLDPATSDGDRARHAELGALAVAAWDEALPALNAARAGQGLPPLDHVLDQGRALTRLLVLSSAAFDLPGLTAPAVEHVGPRLDDCAWAEPWTPPPGDQPLVLVSLSSDYQKQEDVIARIVAALAELPVRAVVTTGKGIEPESLATVSGPRTQVVRSAPHREVLRHAALVVCHGGHGTTIKALAAGVPLVVLPMGRDQLDVAVRVVHRGAGVRIEPSAPPEQIAAAVVSVLSDPSFSAAAARLAAAIAAETAEDRAVAAIEAAVMPRVGQI